MDEAAADQEDARAQLLDALDATPEKLAGARRIMHQTGHDRAPDQQAMGRQAAGVIAGESIIVEERHSNVEGDRLTTGYRRNGPHFEKVVMREVQIGPNTFALVEHNGQNRTGRRY